MAGPQAPRILIFPGGPSGAAQALAAARGYVAVPARDVEAGLDLLATQPFDVAVLADEGPLEGTLALCRRLRAAPGGDRVAVVAVTGSAGATAALLEAGATVVAAALEPSIAIQLDAAVWWGRRPSAHVADRAPAERALLERAARSFGDASAEVIKAAEDALRTSEERMRLVVRATSDAFWDWDLSSGRVTGSERMRSFYGTGGADIEEDAAWWFERVHPEDRDRVMNGLRRAMEGDEGTFELWYRCLLADGSYADVHDRGIVLRDATGRAYRMLGAVSDVTERRQMETRLQLADRMASLGTLAAGVAHEINNPLAYMVANVDFARKELRAKGAGARLDALLSALDEAAEGGSRVRHIVGGLKTFSRADDGELGPVDVDPVIQLVLRMAQQQIQSKARLVLELRPVPAVRANEAQLGQVILNLLVNAAQALPEGKVSENEIRISTAPAPPGRVCIEVCDTGPGIAPDLQSRIFDPFFTTKPIGEGTGLGLAICHGIVTSFRGEIGVESEVGKGACFRVLLPVHDRRAGTGEERDAASGGASDESPEEAAQ
ncbi:histidine kinase [Sorangium cellulosum So ce56]|uniref:histidine kinase n=1 Tax=Sorangium cellulosum (strain So ce56) TaxID=448385 RepID=A9F143_SORC5|nr:histidine kinase [Sorangium cellulosum So ce56]